LVLGDSSRSTLIDTEISTQVMIVNAILSDMAADDLAGER
jgi:hypothetical protein